MTIFDSATLAVRGAAPVAREPRAIVISDDGKTAFVSHAVGAIVSRIDLASTKTDEIGLRGWRQGMDLETAKARSVPHAHGTELAAVDRDEAGEATCQGFALAKSTGRIFAPQVAVDPGDAEKRPDGYGDPNEDTESPAISVVTGIASRPTDRAPTAEETETCFAEMTSEALDSARANHADHPAEWGDSGFSAQIHLYRRSADYPQGGVSAVHLERFEEKNGTPTLEMTDAWADPATRGARVFAQKSVPLALVATSAFGVRVFAVRDDHAKEKVVQFVVVPDATQRGDGQSSMIGMASDGQTTARSQCGHLRIALPVTDEGASAKLFVSVIVGEAKSDPKVTVSGASELRSKRRRHREGEGIPKFRALSTQVSVSKTSRDPEPVVSVSFGWAARESTERLF